MNDVSVFTPAGPVRPVKYWINSSTEKAFFDCDHKTKEKCAPEETFPIRKHIKNQFFYGAYGKFDRFPTRNGWPAFCFFRKTTPANARGFIASNVCSFYDQRRWVPAWKSLRYWLNKRDVNRPTDSFCLEFASMSLTRALSIATLKLLIYFDSPVLWY